MTLEQRLHRALTPTHDAEGRPLDADMQAAEAKAAWDRFETSLRRIFHTTEGQRVLSALCRIAHPMASRFEGTADALQAARRDGECSVVALLWTFGAQAVKPESSTPTN